MGQQPDYGYLKELQILNKHSIYSLDHYGVTYDVINA